MTAQRGQVIKVGAGYSVRWRDSANRRRQRGVFPTKREANDVLEDELKKVRLGSLYKPDLTLNELVKAFLDQYDASEGSRTWLTYYLRFSQDAFGNQRISTLDAHQIGAWRSKMRGLKGKPASDHMKHSALRALRQVLEAALRWGWIEKNPATLVKNEAARPASFVPFDTWEQVYAIASELDPEWFHGTTKKRHETSSAVLVITGAGTGLRLEELFALHWSDIDLDASTMTVRRAYAKGVMKEYTKTAGSTRTIPLRNLVASHLRWFHAAYPGTGLVFQSERGGPINLNNWRRREWIPAQEFAGITPLRRPYDLRHTYATWSLAAGVNPFQVARRMGTSLAMLNQTYGHLMIDADAAERITLDQWDDA